MPGLNWRRFWRFYFSVYSIVFVSIEKTEKILHMNTRYSVSSLIQTPQVSSKILHCVCSSYFQLTSVFGYPDETLSLVLDVLLAHFYIVLSQNVPSLPILHVLYSICLHIQQHQASRDSTIPVFFNGISPLMNNFLVYRILCTHIF